MLVLLNILLGWACTQPVFCEVDGVDEYVSAGGSGAFLQDSVPLLDAVPPYFVRIAPADSDGNGGDDNDDYYPTVQAASQGKVFHFKTMPIPVYINGFPDNRFIASVVRGFETWQERTGGAVRFVQVEDPTKARIQVAWKRLGRDRDDAGCVVGAHTITRYSENGKGGAGLFTISGVPVPMYVPKAGSKYAVPPQVIEVNLDLLMSKGANVRYRLLQNVVTHELGHALGLLGHSSNPNDMMFSVTDEHSRLSGRDVRTLIRLYELKPDVVL